MNTTSKPQPETSQHMQSLNLKRIEQPQDAAPAINDILTTLPDNTCLNWEKGTYFIGQKLLLQNKENIVIDGNGSTLLVHNCPEQDYRHSTDAFHLENCRQVTLKNFHLKAEKPSNQGGFIQAVGPDYVDMKFYAQPPLTGRERFIHAMAFNNQGRPLGIHWCCNHNSQGVYSVIAGEFTTSAPELFDTPHTKLDENLFRVPFTKAQEIIRPGTRCTIMHTNCGLSGFVFRNCENMTIDTVTISDFGGFAYVILPRCRNFTFRNLCFKPQNPKTQPYSCTVDAIHTTGLGGKLIIEDSYFNGVGDDILNSHTQALKVTEINGDKITLAFDKPHARFPPRWGQPGDRLNLHSGQDLGHFATCTIKSVDENVVTLQPEENQPFPQLKRGDFIVNTAYCPDIIVRNCTAVNCRSRFCIEAANSAEFHHNHFDMVSFLPPIYISSAFNYWAEAGEVKNVNIHHNRIDCTPDPLQPNHGGHREAIWIRVNDPLPGGDEQNKNCYRNITIKHNHMNGNLVATHVRGLIIEHNQFDQDPEQAIRIDPSCTEVTVKNNRKTN